MLEWTFYVQPLQYPCGHQAAEEREPDVFLWQGGGTAEPQDDAGREGGTEEAVKQENKR